MSGEKRNGRLFELAERLTHTGNLSDQEFTVILESDDPEIDKYLGEKARIVREKYYGKEVYLRGLIEFTSFCRNNCFYCGIRRDNRNAERYRLTEEEIISCSDKGYKLGFRTFVLQGGEDPYFTDERLLHIIMEIKARYPDCAITLSLGERETESYLRLFEAGADRYLLRHETADKDHYGRLHPKEMIFENRMKCLKDLKKIGYQVGCGMMVGSPYQRTEHLVKDIRFIQKLQPEMVGIGPFIPHHETVFAKCEPGTVRMTLRLLSLIRLVLPEVLLPATTALGTVDAFGREKGLLAGANVVMPNLSPTEVRGKYLLYDNKICTGDEAAECIRCMRTRVSKVGYHVIESRGDHPSFKPGYK